MSYLIVMVMDNLLVFMAIGILAYVLNSIALYKLAKRENIANPGLSWIPICNYYC